MKCHSAFVALAAFLAAPSAAADCSHVQRAAALCIAATGRVCRSLRPETLRGCVPEDFWPESEDVPPAERVGLAEVSGRILHSAPGVPVPHPDVWVAVRLVADRLVLGGHVRRVRVVSLVRPPEAQRKLLVRARRIDGLRGYVSARSWHLLGAAADLSLYGRRSSWDRIVAEARDAVARRLGSGRVGFQPEPPLGVLHVQIHLGPRELRGALQRLAEAGRLRSPQRSIALAAQTSKPPDVREYR